MIARRMEAAGKPHEDDDTSSVADRSDVDDDSIRDLRLDTARYDTPSPSTASSPPLPFDRKGNLLSPERVRPYASPERSPARRPSTPLRGIGKFLQHRRRDASPDSPGVRADLLSGSVVAGLVATAIQEVEASAPHPQKNKPMADLVERAIKAEFKLDQLEQQKSQLWNLVSIAEQEADAERKKQLNLVSLMLVMIGVDALVLVYASSKAFSQVQQFIGSILAVHLTILASAAYVLKRLCYARNEEEEEEEDADDVDVDSRVEESVLSLEEPATMKVDEPAIAKEVRQDSPEDEEDSGPSEKQRKALEELKETLALLPMDQKGISWIREAPDKVLVAFLRGYVFNVSKAFKYVVKCAEWREDFKANALVASWEMCATKSAELLKQTFPVSFLGSTPQGQRVYLFRMGMCDFPGYYRCCAAEDVTRHTLYEFEKHCTASGYTPAVLLVDLGVNPDDENRPVSSVGQLQSWIAGALQYLSALTKICDPCYPEVFSDIYILRTPMPFWATWRVAQLLIPVRTREKFTILNVADCETKLAERLAIECIPDFLGGEADTSGAPKGGMIVASAAWRALQTSSS